MKKALVIAVVFIFAAVFCPKAYAAGDDAFPFTVEVIPPANQIGGGAYYHVPGAPGERIAFTARLINLTGQPLDIKVVAMNAYSSGDGIIYQSPAQAQNQAYSMADEKYALSKYMEFYDQIVLAPNESKQVAFAVIVPDIGPGTILGCIRFVIFSGTNELPQPDNERSVQILVDEYQAVDTAVQIDIPGEQQACIIAENTLFNSENLSLEFDIVNMAAVIQDNISGAYEILGMDGAVMFSGSIAAFKMAPFTRFKYSVPWQYETLEEGEYSLSLTLHVNGELSSFDLPFTIGDRQVAQAAMVQQETKKNEAVKPTEIKIQKSPSSWIVLGCAAALLICLLLFMGAQKKGMALQNNVNI